MARILIHLLDMNNNDGEYKRPSTIVRELGLRYREWVSQPIADQIWLLGVDLSSIPASGLPSFMTLDHDDRGF